MWVRNSLVQEGLIALVFDVVAVSRENCGLFKGKRSYVVNYSFLQYKATKLKLQEITLKSSEVS